MDPRKRDPERSLPDASVDGVTVRGRQYERGRNACSYIYQRIAAAGSAKVRRRDQKNATAAAPALQARPILVRQ